MNQRQVKAGYCLEGILGLKDDKDYGSKYDGLLNRLCSFELFSNSSLKLVDPNDSHLAVIQNLIVRGLPTIPSLELEKTFATEFPDWVKPIESKIGKIGFQINSEKRLSLYEALHVIDPNLNSGDYPKDSLGSDFERDFLFKLLPIEWRFIYQILQPQRPIVQMVAENVKARFYNQNADFCLDVPYRTKEEITLRADKKHVLTSKGYVIEIDGVDYHRWGQLNLDWYRDEAVVQNNWEAIRVKSDKVNEGINNLINYFSNDEYVRIVKNNLNRHWDESWKEALQVALIPFGVARVQFVLCQLLGQNAFFDKEKINIAVIERDVPCATMAVNGFIALYNKLAKISKDAPPNLPNISLSVYCDSRFEGSPLNKLHPPTDIFKGQDLSQFDIVIDISVLRRELLETYSNSPNRIVIRSSHSNNNEFSRKFVTSKNIQYKSIDDKVEEQLRYFLQNIFRKDNFRPGQIPILDRALQNKTVIGLLPTGGGKSLTYQLAALLQPGITLVVDPIKSLMQDQYFNLTRIGVDGCNFINSTLDTTQRNFAIKHLKGGKVLFSFISPERLLIEEFRLALQEMSDNKIFFSYCVIDEVHCLSEWGHDFRPAYLKLGDNAYKFCKTASGEPISLFGLTATASYDVLADIERELSQPDKPLEDATIRFENTTRNEIQYNIIPVKTDFPSAPINGFENGFPEAYSGEGANTPTAARNTIGKSKLNELLAHLNQLPSLFNQFLNDEKLCDILAHAYNNLIPAELHKDLTPEKYINDKLSNLKINVGNKFFNDEHDFAGIIFCPHKKETSSLGVLRFKSNIDAEFEELKTGYFMGTSGFTKSEAKEIEFNSFQYQLQFVKDELDMMIATKAFGMGIDKPNIRYSYHVNYPGSIESFVQEGGRTGRDRGIAIVNVLYNDEAFASLRKSNHQIRMLGLPQANTNKLLAIRNKLFRKNDFYEKVLPTILSDEVDILKVKEKTSEESVDRDVLLYFHNKSFKGKTKELTTINELLNEIWFPIRNNLQSIADEVQTEFGIDNVFLKEWNGERVYVNTSLGDLGYLNIPTMNPVVSFEHASESFPNSLNILKWIQGKILSSWNNAIPFADWLNQSVELVNETGILKILEKSEEGEKLISIIPFQNSLGNPEFYTKRLTKFIHEFVSNDIHPGWVKDQCTLYINSLDELIEKINGHENSPDDWFENLSEKGRKKFFNIYYLPRDEDDTAKAVYRLYTIGIIDDYTIDYNANQYTVEFYKKPVEAYKKALQDYLLRYKSEKSVASILKVIPLSNIREEIETCVKVLVDFVYEQIAAKRERAIDDMDALCKEGLAYSDKFEANKQIKEFIYTYFNSKYAREKPPHTVEVKGEEKEYSLVTDTNKGKEFNWDITFKYLEVLGIDTTGGFDDNVKHLRGAARRLLRGEPNNATLRTLNGFSQLMLAINMQNQSLKSEGEKELTIGIAGLVEKEGDFDANHVKRRIQRLKDIVGVYIINPEQLLIIIDNVLDSVLIKRHTDWLENFNHKFLKDYHDERNTLSDRAIEIESSRA